MLSGFPSHFGCFSYGYWFPIAAITNDYNLGGFKHKHYLGSSGAQKSEMSFRGLKSRCQQTDIPSSGSRGKSVSLLFPAT